jgi:GNAT superfamily N-acetyltransferase
MSDFTIAQLRHGLGASLISLQSEFRDAIRAHEDDGWVCFPGTHSDANFSLIATGDAQKYSQWVHRLFGFHLEHYIFVAGEAQKLPNEPLLLEEYIQDDSLPLMSYDLVKLGDGLVADPRVQKAATQDREDVAKLLALSFETSVACQRSFVRATGHSSPNIASYIIRENGEPGGALLATLSVSVVGEIAGLWSLSVSPRARRQGLASAVLASALLHAKRLGSKVAVLIASKEGIPVYEKLGWTTVEWFHLWCTRDSFYTIKDFPQHVNLPSLRKFHGEAVVEMVRGAPDAIHLESDEENWMVIVPGGSYCLVQSGDQCNAESWKKKIMDVGVESPVFLVGNALKRFRSSVFSDWLEDPANSMTAFAYDLQAKGSTLKKDPRIRIATSQDRKDITNLYIEAFDEKPLGEVSPHAFVAGHNSPDIVTFVIEFDGVVLATLTTAITESIVHLWSLAVSKTKRRQGLASALLNTALAHAYERGGVKTAFLAATDDGAPLYRVSGWSELEHWPALWYPGKAITRPE